MGLRVQVCPYHLTREQQVLDKADLVIVPYNYLVDGSIRETGTMLTALQCPLRSPIRVWAVLGIDWHDAVIIFDEAHNLVRLKVV